MPGTLDNLRNEVGRVGDAARKAKERVDARASEAQKREAGLLQRIADLEAENAQLKAVLPDTALLAQLTQSLATTASELEQL